MSKLIKDISEHSYEHGSIPFWSWNDKLDPERLRKQIRDMKRLNMKGFFMHARSGLETEYMSDEWFECIEASIDEAKKLGMEAWSYDENGWPSGFAGGALLKDEANHARYLECETRKEFPTDDPLGVYIIHSEHGRTLCTKIEKEIFSPTEYLCIYRRSDSSYVDTMDADITKKFVESTHVEYKKRIGADFGKDMPGFFCDEPQYYRWHTPWSDKLPGEFLDRYGYCIYDKLPALFVDFDGAEEFRHDYWKLAHDLFINNFIKVIYEWCVENDCKITGHALEEMSLSGQMMGCGGIMPYYEYQTIPGVDFLGRNSANDMSAKQVGSAAAQLGKKQVISEMFACCGWDVMPSMLKKIAEQQYFCGVNLMCQHLYPYSERGQRKRDYPAHYSEHLSWQEGMADFNKYFNNLGYTLARGRERANVLLIHPIRSAYLGYKRELHWESIRELEDNIHETLIMLSDDNVHYHFGDEDIMAKYGSVEGNRIRVGECEYDCVALPLLYDIDSTTAELLREYLSNGGRLCLLPKAERLPDRIDGRIADMSWLKPNTDYSELLASKSVFITGKNGEQEKGFRVMVRDTAEYGRIYYVFNYTAEKRTGINIEIPGASDLSVVSMEDLSTYGISENGKAVLDFDPFESYIITGDKQPIKEKSEPKFVHLENVRVRTPKENAYTLDYASYSLDGENYTDKRPIVRIKDELLQMRYEGDLYLKFTFEAENVPSSCKVAAEILNYKGIWVNGNEITLSDEYWFDESFRTADILPYLKPGENEITFRIRYFQNDYVYYVLYGGTTEALRNCLNFDTEIESVYLVGDFAVKTEANKFTPAHHNSWSYTGGFVLTESDGKVDPANLVASGYPFYNGSVEITAQCGKDAGELVLKGHYAVAEITVNGKQILRLLFKDHCDISEYLDREVNDVGIKIYTAARNLLGVHHCEDTEPISVSPPDFSFESMWHDGRCKEYHDRYAFVEFGVELP